MTQYKYLPIGDMSRRMSAEDPDDLPQGQQPANGFVRIWVKDAEKVQCNFILIQAHQFLLLCKVPILTVLVSICQVDTVTALGRWSHHVYVVRMDSTVPGLVASGMEVRRRFSEFDVRIPLNGGLS